MKMYSVIFFELFGLFRIFTTEKQKRKVGELDLLSSYFNWMNNSIFLKVFEKY
jgi:hypothetical protein